MLLPSTLYHLPSNYKGAHKGRPYYRGHKAA